MITDSYSASCYIENNDGQYHMECDMQTNDKDAYAEYDGDDFVTGLNTLMDELTKKMFEEPEQEKEPETLEEKVIRLEELVDELLQENHELNETINNLTSDKCNCKKDNDDKIDDIVKHLKDTMEDYLNNSKITYDDLYKWSKDSTKLITPRWLFK